MSYSIMRLCIVGALISVAFLISSIGNQPPAVPPTSPAELQPEAPQNQTVDEPRDLKEIVPGRFFRLTYSHGSKKSTEEQLVDAIHHLAGNSYEILSTDTVVLSRFSRDLYESHTNIVVRPFSRNVPVPGYVQ